ncbi:hypothetical protein BC826DRAFT_1155464 [Russula brevipes]|nr:hypothetical protein BC826DRAFT_1155464 [Russula brevipes]
MTTSTNSPPNFSLPGDIRQTLFSLLSSVSARQAPPHPAHLSRFRPLLAHLVVLHPPPLPTMILKAVFLSNNNSWQATRPPMGSSPTFLLVGLSQHPDTSSYKSEAVTQQTATEVTHGSVSVEQSQKQGSPPQTSRCLALSHPSISSSVAPIRKPVVQPPPHQLPLINSPLEPFEDTWSSAVIDPKRKSVDNLLEELGNSKHSPEEETPSLRLPRVHPNTHKPLRRVVPAQGLSPRSSGCSGVGIPSRVASQLGSFACAYGPSPARKRQLARSAWELEGTRRWPQPWLRLQGKDLLGPK